MLVVANLDLRHFLTYLFPCLATTLSEKERNLNSVISALTKQEEEHKICLAQALIMRAQLGLDYTDAPLERAQTDARRAVVLDPQHPNVWRVLADIELHMGNSAQAIEALQKWAQNQPKFATKVNKELKRLSLLT